MSTYHLAVGVLALLNLASIALSLLMWVRLQRLESEFRGGAPPVAEPPSPSPEAVPDKFSSALMGGEMNLRRARELREPPEKYRFIGSLADQGMEAAEIAQTLHLSVGEVEQLLTLGRLGRRNASFENES